MTAGALRLKSTGGFFLLSLCADAASLALLRAVPLAVSTETLVIVAALLVGRTLLVDLAVASSLGRIGRSLAAPQPSFSVVGELASLPGRALAAGFIGVLLSALVQAWREPVYVIAAGPAMLAAAAHALALAGSYSAPLRRSLASRAGAGPRGAGLGVRSALLALSAASLTAVAAPLTLALLVPATASPHRVQILALAGALVMLAAALAVAASFADTLDRSIADLGSAATRLADGLTTDFPLPALVGLGDLADRLRILATAHEQLRRLSDERVRELETRVASLEDETRAIELSARARAEGMSPPRAERPDEAVDFGALAALARSAEATLEELDGRARSALTEADLLLQKTESSTHAADAMGEITRRLDKGTTGLSSAAQEAAGSTQTMDDAIRRVQSGAQETSSLSAQVSQEAERGYRAVHRTLDEIERIRTLSEQARSIIDALGGRVEGIGQVVLVIEEIAEKTNLLALNASIIAAQAGEQGRGFAVVAAEIKALAQRTAASTKQIADQIRGVQEESTRAMSAMASGVDAVSQGFQVAVGAGDALGAIRESARRAQKKVQSIVRAMGEQTTASRRVTDASGRVAEQAIDIAGAVRDQTALGDRVRAAAEELAGVAGRLGPLLREQAGAHKGLAQTLARLEGEASQAARGDREVRQRLERVAASLATIKTRDVDLATRLTALGGAMTTLRGDLERLRSELGARR